MTKNTFWCDHPQTRLVYKTFSNGSINYYRQCCLCLKPASDWISKKSLGNKTLGAIDDQSDGNGLVYPKSQREWRELGEKQRAYSMKRYDENYLSTPAWQAKREKVMTRDHSHCQANLRGCTTRATEVHHLSYTNVPNEPIEDLIAICHHCHEQITREGKIQWATL